MLHKELMERLLGAGMSINDLSEELLMTCESALEVLYGSGVDPELLAAICYILKMDQEVDKIYKLDYGSRTMQQLTRYVERL